MNTFTFIPYKNGSLRESAKLVINKFTIEISGANNKYDVWRYEGNKANKMHPVLHHYTKEQAINKANKLVKIALQNN